MKTTIKAVLAGVFAMAMFAACTGERGGSRNPASSDQGGASAMSTPSKSGSSGSSGGGM